MWALLSSRFEFQWCKKQMFSNNCSMNERINQSFSHLINPSSATYRVCNIGHVIRNKSRKALIWQGLVHRTEDNWHVVCKHQKKES